MAGLHAVILTLSLRDRLRLSTVALKYSLDLFLGQRPAFQFDSLELELVKWYLNPAD